MRTPSRLHIIASNILLTATVLFSFLSPSSAWYRSGYFDSMNPDSDRNGAWTDSDYTKIDDGYFADANYINLVANDSSIEQVFGFSDPLGDEKPEVCRVRLYVYGKKVGAPNPLQVRISVGGCWLNPQSV